MSDLMDLIYIVFDELNKAKKEEDQDTVAEKEAELEKLREKLAHASKTKGGMIYSLPRA